MYQINYLYIKDRDMSTHFDVSIPDNHTLRVSQDSTFEHFIAQLQPLSSKLLCVIDGTTLRYYDNAKLFPTNIRFDYKQKHGSVVEYYFRDNSDDTLYCVFGQTNARLFYPSLNPINMEHSNTAIPNIYHDPLSTPLSKVVSKPSIKPASPKITRRSPNDSPSNVVKPKRPPIIEQLTTSYIQHASKTTGNIIIIDKGVKMTFPDCNYNVDITTY